MVGSQDDCVHGVFTASFSGISTGDIRKLRLRFISIGGKCLHQIPQGIAHKALENIFVRYALFKLCEQDAVVVLR